MEGELSVPRNVQPLPGLVRGTDRISAATPKRDGRPGRARRFDLGAHRQADEEPSDDGAPAEHESEAADTPADGPPASAPPSAEGDEKHLDYRA